MSSHSRFYYILSFISGIAVAALIFFFKHDSHNEPHVHAHDEEQNNENQIKLTPMQLANAKIEVRTAEPGEIAQTLFTRGKIILDPNRFVHVIPKVSGVAVEVEKNIGNFVKANELLAILESREIADIKAAYLTAVNKRKLAASVWHREQKLFQEKVSSGEDYFNARSAYEEARINTQVSLQNLKSFGLSSKEIEELSQDSDTTLRFYSIRSPMQGIVVMRHIIQGEFIENTTTIFEIADLSKVWVEIGIYPKDLPLVKEGQSVEVMLPSNNKGITAPLIYVSPIIEDETITAKAVAELENMAGIWRPGTFVKVNIESEKRTVPLMISQEAILTEEEQSYIFVVIPGGFEKRFVKVGMSDNENIEIISGLNAGEQYASRHVFLLKADLGKNSAEHEH